MNELERTALNEILRTVTYIAEKVDELDSNISLSINDNQEKKNLLIGVEKIMADLISEKGLKNSIPVAEIATAVITLSNGKRIEVTNPVMQIVELFRFVENPKNRFLNIGGVMVNINQIATMKWITENPFKGDV